MSVISATAAMVEPSLKLLVSVTVSPSRTGISRMVPRTVDLISLDTVPASPLPPSRISVKLLRALDSSSRLMSYSY